MKVSLWRDWTWMSVCEWTASVSLLGLHGKAEMSPAYHFPGTDAPIYHPLSVWFQSVLYLLISPQEGEQARAWHKSTQEGRLFILDFINNLLPGIYNTPRDDIASSYEAAVRRNTTHNCKIKKERKKKKRGCPDGLIKPFWREEVTLGHGVAHNNVL